MMRYDVLGFMMPTPDKLNRITVRSLFLRMGLGSSKVKVWGELNKVFVKKIAYLPKREYDLFYRVIKRLGGYYRQDYGVWVVEVSKT